MARPKKNSKVIQVTLTEFHMRKLDLTCGRTGLTRSEILQRLIENYDLFKDQKAKASPAAG